MVRRLFRDDPPTGSDRILYPGCGDAPFAATVEDICETEGWQVPAGYAVETNPEHLEAAKSRGVSHAEFHEQDFLAPDMLDVGVFTYIVGNPPYVPIEGLTADEKQRYSAAFATAIERFDLYLLFFERALELLAPGGILSFVTPEKFEYVDTATPLRRLLTNGDIHVVEITRIDENAFADLVTFPSITTVRRFENDERPRGTRVTLRDGTTHTTTLPKDGASWASNVRGADLDHMETGATLSDVTERISPGLATGADSVFVFDANAVPDEIDDRWVYPTVSGRQLREFDGPYTNSVFVCPYTDTGELADEGELGSFFVWLEEHRKRLEDRSCVENGKLWYAWHENPPMQDILRPKIVFRDITREPQFWPDDRGDVVPKHSVYYAVPDDSVPLDDILEYLNSPEARMWMKAHNGYYRLQSRVLRDLPVPKKWVETFQATL